MSVLHISCISLTGVLDVNERDNHVTNTVAKLWYANAEENVCSRVAGTHWWKLVGHPILRIKQSGSSTSWEIIEIHCVISQLENRWGTIWEDFGEVLQHLGNLKEIFQSL